MRRVIVFLLCSLAVWGQSSMALSKDNQFLFSANSEETIINWGQKRYGPVLSEKIGADGEEVIILSADTGFGTSRLIVFVYLWAVERKKWELLLIRQTNTSKISASYNQDSREISVYSKVGKRLFTLPLEGLNLDFDSNE
jgi:hypothetical protein